MRTTERLPEEAGTVIVGAGIVGCNVAYQLTQLGREDVVVVDQGPMPTTGGSSTHAPGIMFQTAEPKELTQFANYSRQLYSQLEGADGQQAYNETGGIEVARSCGSSIPQAWAHSTRRFRNAMRSSLRATSMPPVSLYACWPSAPSSWAYSCRL